MHGPININGLMFRKFSLILFRDESLKSCTIKHKQYFIALCFSTFKNLQTKNAEGMCYFTLQPKMPSRISDLAYNPFWV